MCNLNSRIARFYDVSSQLWEDVWGEHMHHGFYHDGKRGDVDKIRAQELLIEKLLELGSITSPQEILDVGCGIGGSSRYLAKKFGASVTGITLSPHQVERAKSISSDSSPEESLNFLVADAQNIPCESNHFDLVWSMESAEHFPDKIEFLKNAIRVLKPGGKLLLATWCCHKRPLTSAIDRMLLGTINAAYALPPWVVGPEYLEMTREVGFTDIVSGDWSPEVKPFWGEVLRHTVSFQGLRGLVKAGPTVIRGAAVVPLMMYGFHRGTIKFFVMSATKPAME